MKLGSVFERRSITFATIALFFGLAALARVFNFAEVARQHGWEFVQQSLVICVVSFAVCTAVLINLVFDVTRGYSPSRCSLAAVITLAAFTGPVMLALTLIGHNSR